MRSAESAIHTAFVFNPNVEFTGLLRFVLKDLGVSTWANDKHSLLEQLNDYLIQKLQDGQIVALLLDEAQQLSDRALEELRLLSNLETENEKLIQIVLMGQPELEQSNSCTNRYNTAHENGSVALPKANDRRSICV
jgi:general secretion pathway protein A